MADPFLVHCHIPKTGGSALNRQLLVPSFGEDRIHWLYRYVFECAAGLPLRHRARSMRALGATGHVPYGYYRNVYPDALYISVFREPLTRFVSFLNFICANPGHAVRRRIAPEIIAAAAADPDRLANAILTEPRLKVVHSDVQTRLAAGLPRLGEVQVGEDDLDHAFHNLLRPDYLWGAQENLTTFADQIENWLHAGRHRVRRVEDVPDTLVKRLERHFVLDDLSPTTQARISAANTLDRQLYDQVQRGVPPGLRFAA